MKSALRALPWLLLLAAFVLIGLDYRTISILRSENEGWKATLQAREAAASQDGGVMQAKEAELARLRSEAEQLPKLRGELTHLRGTTGEVARLQHEVQRLAAENQQLRIAPSPTAEAAAPPPATAAVRVARERFAFAGYGTPEASLLSIIWAMSQGDLKAVLAGTTPEMQARSQNDWANKTEQQITEELKRESQKLMGFQVLKSELTEDGATTITVFMDGENKSKKIKFRRVGEEWKMSPR